jgi:hypothetical protein
MNRSPTGTRFDSGTCFAPSSKARQAVIPKHADNKQQRLTNRPGIGQSGL